MSHDYEDNRNVEKIGYYESICRMIGCSGLNDKCPGNKDCSIIMKITHRTNCGSNHAATGVYQGDVLSPRYRVRVDPEKDLFCVVDRQTLKGLLNSYSVTPTNLQELSTVDVGCRRKYWPDFNDALAFAKLLDKAV